MSQKFFQHKSAICESSQIGDGTRIWAFTHILPGARIGADCNVCDHVFVENDVVVGDRVTLKSGVQLWDGVTLEDDVFIGPNVTFTNDPFPRSRQRPKEFLKTLVCAGASIGANATINPGLVIGTGAMVGSGSVVTRSVPPHALVMGNPAVITGYVDTVKNVPYIAHAKTNDEVDKRPAVMQSQVSGVTLHKLTMAADMRGELVASEYPKTLPFEPKRTFFVFKVPNRRVRGEHAHRKCKQFLICLHGSVNIIADDGTKREEFVLDRPDLGLFLPAMIWGVQYKYTEGAILAVMASDPYEASDYIRDYSEFIKEISDAKGAKGHSAA